MGMYSRMGCDDGGKLKVRKSNRKWEKCEEGKACVGGKMDQCVRVCGGWDLDVEKWEIWEARKEVEVWQMPTLSYGQFYGLKERAEGQWLTVRVYVWRIMASTGTDRGYYTRQRGTAAVNRTENAIVRSNTSASTLMMMMSGDG